MPRPIDLAVVAQDPWFGGGARAHLEAFLTAAGALGREPHVLFVRRGAARPLGVPSSPYRSVLAPVDSVNQLLAARMARALRRARSVWVVASAAHYGLAARLAGRRYGCWIGTGLADERRGRLAGGLAGSRALALRANAHVLERAERAVLAGAAAVYATSPASRRSLAAAGGLAESSVRTLPLPVDVARFAPEDDERWLARLEAPRIAFAGRADDPRKNVGLLLEAFARLRERMPRARLRLVGSPPAGPLPPGVETAGVVDDLAPLLREASLLVLPSRQEGFGLVAAEALASGVPAVVTPSGGPEELVRASGGGVVLPDFDADTLAVELSALLADGGRLLELRRRGRAYVEREHSPERLREALALALEEVDAHG